jgi:ComF family protein
VLCASHKGGNLGLCQPCLKDLPWHSARQCPQCALITNGTLCGSCLSTPPSFDATTALLTYDYPADGLLQHYKYNASLNLAHTFAALFVEEKHAKSIIKSEIDLIIPMPMHQNRLKERGFNQALEVAKRISRDLKIRLDYTSCLRTKHTPPQASLNLKDRIKNIKGAFNCQQNLEHLNIAMVDDVMTTGASLNELAKTLKQAGAAHVECWVMARTLPK